MDEKILKELRAKLEVGKGYYFGSEYNGGGYDWENMGMFDESIRFDIECWIESTAMCGFQTDVNLYRVADDELDFTSYASNVSPSWYGEDVKLYNDTLFNAMGLESWFGKLYEDVSWSFEYENVVGNKSSIQLAENFKMYGIHNASNEDVAFKLNKLPPDFNDRLKSALDGFAENLKAPDNFTKASVRITSDYHEDHCIVEETWKESFVIKI